MPPSSQSLTPYPSSILKVTLATARPNMSGPFVSGDAPIGVAAWVNRDGKGEPHWMAGYAKADDFARAAMVLHLLRLPEYQGAVLEVASSGFRGTLPHVPGARARCGLKTNGKPFEGFDVFDPVEAALRRGEWRLVERRGGDVFAGQALEVAMSLIPEFDQHKAAHPQWWMLRVGRTSNPLGRVT